MTNYPLSFYSTTQSANGISTNWSTISGRIETAVSVPVEFEGPGDGLSPEDLFNHALANCFVATFKVYAEKSKLDFESITATSKLIVDLDENQKPIMKEFHIQVVLLRPSNESKALVLMQKAAKGGFILNSVKTKLHFNFAIEK